MMSTLLARALPVAAVVLALGAPAAASAAEAPGVATGTATKVTQSTATLRATVNPRDVETSYVFQYGPTKAYGATTPAVAIGKGTSKQAVTADIAGLAPATVYHFRVVATSGAGTSRGGDRTFTTQKQPLGLSLAATPNPVPFGSPVTLAGTLSGTDNVGRQIILQQNAFPFTAGFTTVGNPQVTTSGGAFSFPILSLTTTTQYRVQIPGRPVASPIVTALVSVTVGTRVSRTRVKRGRKVNFNGTITPVRDGANVAVQKLNSKGAWVTIGGTIAKRFQSTRSRYSVSVRIRRGGSYRVFVGTNSGDISNNVGRTVKLRTFR